MTAPKVSIIFPNFNGGKEPLECLLSIEKLNYPKNRVETIVIDNNSTDGSDQEIKAKFPKVRLIKNKINLGFGKAINQGVRQSSGKYIFIGNDDIIFDKNSLKIMVSYVLDNPHVGILGGKIFLKARPKKICSSGYMFNYWTGNVYPSLQYNRIHQPDWVQGCALLISKALIKKIGGIDEGFSYFFEDFDLSQKAKKLGFQVLYLPTARFWHGESLTANKNLPEKYYQWYKNKLRFMIKNLSIRNILSILIIQILVITPYRLLVLHDKRFMPLVKGLWWNIINIKKTLALRRYE